MLKWTVEGVDEWPVIGIELRNTSASERSLVEILGEAFRSASVSQALRDCAWRLRHHYDARVAEQAVRVLALAIFLDALDGLGLVHLQPEEYRREDVITFVIQARPSGKPSDYTAKLAAAAGRETTRIASESTDGWE